jgi:hypothetical protein
LLIKRLNTRVLSSAGRRATEFLRDLGLAESGKNRKDLKERFNRLSGLTIGISRRNGDDSILMPLIEEKSLPASIMSEDPPIKPTGNDSLLANKQAGAGEALDLPPVQRVAYGFKLNDRLFKDILAHNIPIPLTLLQKTRKQSQMQDLILFLYWRSYVRGESYRLKEKRKTKAALEVIVEK